MGSIARPTGSRGDGPRLALLLGLLLTFSAAHLVRQVPRPDPRAPGPPPRQVPTSPAPPPVGRTMAEMMGDPLASLRDTPEYRDAYRRGRDEAEAQLREGGATLYTHGFGMAAGNIDRETGLPWQSIGGCEISAGLEGRTAGHNDRIREHIRSHGLPAGSFLRWKGILFDLEGYFATRGRVEAPNPLSTGGPALAAPDGSTTIRPVHSSFPPPRGCLGIAIDGPGAGRPVAEVYEDEGHSELAWGPAGSGFAVIRCRRHDSDVYLAVDLATGRRIGYRVAGVAPDPPIVSDGPPTGPP